MNPNDYIGLEYDINADTKPIDNKVNCNGLVYMLSDTYKNFIDHVYKKDKSSLFRKLDKKIQLKYKNIDFEDREKDCIIFIRQKGTKIWNHVGYLINRDTVLHAQESLGVVADHISKFTFTNKEFLVFKEKEV